MEVTMPAGNQRLDEKKVIDVLNAILETELAGVVRYTHYSLMIFGHARIPIVKWMREQATEALAHAAEAGEHLTALGGHPSLKIGKLLETHKHNIDQILREAIEHERRGVNLYRELLELVRDKAVYVEVYARSMLRNEELHVTELEKMLRRPGELHPAD
jgi:bacterioferritin